MKLRAQIARITDRVCCRPPGWHARPSASDGRQWAGFITGSKLCIRGDINSGQPSKGVFSDQPPELQIMVVARPRNQLFHTKLLSVLARSRCVAGASPQCLQNLKTLLAEKAAEAGRQDLRRSKSPATVHPARMRLPSDPARRIGLRAAVPSTRDGRSRLAGRARRSSCLASPGSRTRLCRNHDATVFSICTSSRLTPTERDPRLARFDSEVSIHRGAANPLVGCLRVDVM